MILKFRNACCCSNRRNWLLTCADIFPEQLCLPERNLGTFAQCTHKHCTHIDLIQDIDGLRAVLYESVGTGAVTGEIRMRKLI